MVIPQNLHGITKNRHCQILGMCHSHTVLRMAQLPWSFMENVEVSGWLHSWISSGWNITQVSLVLCPIQHYYQYFGWGQYKIFTADILLRVVANDLANHFSILKLYQAWKAVLRKNIHLGKFEDLLGFIMWFMNLTASHLATRKACLWIVQNGKVLQSERGVTKYFRRGQLPLGEGRGFNQVYNLSSVGQEIPEWLV